MSTQENDVASRSHPPSTTNTSTTIGKGTEPTIISPIPLSSTSISTRNMQTNSTSTYIDESGSGSGSVNSSPSRTMSQKRKPVPSYESPTSISILPNSGLPPSHPFASTSTSTPPHSRSHSPGTGSGATILRFGTPASDRLRPSSSLSTRTTRDDRSSSSTRSVSPGVGVGVGGIDRGIGRTPPPPLRKPLGGPAIPPRGASRNTQIDSLLAIDNKDKDEEQNNLDVERDGQRRTTFTGTLSEFMDTTLGPSNVLPLDLTQPAERSSSPSTPRTELPGRPLNQLPTENDNPNDSRPDTPRQRSISAESTALPTTPKGTRRDSPALSPQAIMTDREINSDKSAGQKDKPAKSNFLRPPGPFFRRESDKSKKASAQNPVLSRRIGIGRRPSHFAGYESEEESEFSVDRAPSKQRMYEASTCMLRDEEGNLVSFGDFFPRYGGRKPLPNSSGSGGSGGSGGESTSPTNPYFEGMGNRKGKNRERRPSTAPASILIPGSGSGSKTITGGRTPTPVPASPPLGIDEKLTSRALGGPVPKTVIFFIRHFWCGQCQDYTLASLSLLDPEALERAGIRVIVISNGSWKIIKSYRKLFKCPFPIFVDGPRRLYQLMGMTKMTNDFGPMFKGRAAYNQRPVPTQLLHGLSNAFFRMPLANPGTLTQLGGEFILSPGWKCDFAHRMTNTSNHMEAPEVLRLAGCESPTKQEVADIVLEDEQRDELERLEKEMKAWRAERHQEIERIRQKKAERRGETYVPEERRQSETDPEIFGSSPEQGQGVQLHRLIHARGTEADADAAAEAEMVEVDKRFERIMALEEEREKVKVGTERLMLARGKVDLEVEIEDSK